MDHRPGGRDCAGVAHINVVTDRLVYSISFDDENSQIGTFSLDRTIFRYAPAAAGGSQAEV